MSTAESKRSRHIGVKMKRFNKTMLMKIFIFTTFIVGAFYPGTVGNIALYFINGKSININGHQINLPFSHWAFYKENKSSYILSGRKVGQHTLRIEVSKNPRRLHTDSIKQNCKEVNKNFDHIQGKGYICKYRNNKNMFYFISNDKKIILNSDDDFNSTNQEDMQEYNRLFDSIEN